MTIIEANQKLSENASTIRETADRVVVETFTEGAKKLHKARVSRAGVVNRNRRYYPLALMQREVARLKPLLASGHLAGASDHHSDGPQLSSTCIIFRDLEIESDGAVIAKFETIPNDAGRNLQAQIDSKLAIAFSTVGFGSCHTPSDAERRRYGLVGDEYVVIMDDNYEMAAIDAVASSRPSCADAALLEQHDQDPALIALADTFYRRGTRMRDEIQAMAAHLEREANERDAAGEHGAAAVENYGAEMTARNLLRDLPEKMREMLRPEVVRLTKGHGEARAAAHVVTKLEEWSGLPGVPRLDTTISELRALASAA
jgi:hypothetical protein